MAWILKGVGYGLLAGGWVLGFGLMAVFVGSFFYGVFSFGEWLEGRRDGKTDDDREL